MATSNTEFVQEFAKAMNEDPANITTETLLEDIKGWDSVGQLATLVLIDEHFQRTAAVDRLRACRCLGDVISLCREEQDG